MDKLLEGLQAVPDANPEGAGISRVLDDVRGDKFTLIFEVRTTIGPRLENPYVC